MKLKDNVVHLIVGNQAADLAEKLSEETNQQYLTSPLNFRQLSDILQTMSNAITSAEVLTVLRQKKSQLQASFPLRAMWLFGSVARGDATELSDVDILVDVDPSIGLRIVQLGDELEALLGHPVDLVSIRAISSRMLTQIEQDRIDV